MTSGRWALSKYMPRLSFEIDWVDAEGIRGTELSATWARCRSVPATPSLPVC